MAPLPSALHRQVKVKLGGGFRNKSGDAILHQFRIPSYVRNNNRATAKHRLDDDEGQALVPRRKDESMVGRPDALNVIDLSTEFCALIQSEPSGEAAQSLFHNALTKEGNPEGT